jgi:mannose-1-phosphate guanylyltransferase
MAAAAKLGGLAGMVLAAGKGTRIGALSRLRAKPLLPVGDSTPFARAVASMRAAGVTTIAANASHRASDVIEAGRALGVEVVAEEGGPFGTAGGVAGARSKLDADRVVIWNGDVVANVDLRSLIDVVEGETLAALAVLRVGSAGTGNVGLDDHDRVVRLRDRSFGTETRGAEFAAVHVVSRSIVARAPDRGCMVGDVYLPALREGAVLRAVACVDRWFDIGDLESYLAANLAHAFVSRDVEIPHEITMDRCTVGAGARVQGSGALREVVVWPGRTARAPLERAIVVDGDEIVRV